MTALALEWRALALVETAWVPQPGADVLPAAIVGPPGRDAAASAFEHVQTAAAARWTVNHNLGRWPVAVTVFSPGGAAVDAMVTHVSMSQTLIDFAAPYAGRVRIF